MTFLLFFLLLLNVHILRSTFGTASRMILLTLLFLYCRLCADVRCRCLVNTLFTLHCPDGCVGLCCPHVSIGLEVTPSGWQDANVWELTHSNECPPLIPQLCRMMLLSHVLPLSHNLELCRVVFLSCYAYSVVSLPSNTECCIIQLCRVISLSHNTECCIIQLCRVIPLSCCTYGVISLSHNTECCIIQLCRVVSLSCYTYNVISLSHNTDSCSMQLCMVISMSC